MISAIAWIPLGVAAEVPKYALPEPGIAAEEGFGHNRLVLEDNESEEWEEVSSENTTEDEMADSAPDLTHGL
jgi:hypothetical protein